MTTPILFFDPKGENGWMSNWSHHSVTLDGITFPTAEHCLMHCKAKAFKDERSAAAIEALRTPNTARRAKEIGRSVSPYVEKEWENLRLGVMIRILRAKTEAHPELAERLLATGDAAIGEASKYDTIWGIGMSAKEPEARDATTWRGTNLLGRCWTTLRGYLRDHGASKVKRARMLTFDEEVE